MVIEMSRASNLEQMRFKEQEEEKFAASPAAMPRLERSRLTKRRKGLR
jgi:hypothetical protein